MDARQERGMAIAAMSRIDRTRDGFIVPSQTGTGSYTVSMNDEPRCTCPDWELRRVKCKHIFATEYFMQREDRPDGTTVITKAVRVTYKQDWPAYNAAQTHEGEQFVQLLRGLCAGIVQPKHEGRGHPKLPLSDVVFSTVFKTYTALSTRRFMSDLRDANDKGLVDTTASPTSLFRYLENPALTPILTALIEESALPLKATETNFAVDSSGFSTSVYARWYDHKYGKERKAQTFLKAHLMVGVNTQIVTSVEVTDGNSNDSPHLPALLTTTAKGFQVNELSADKGYISAKNLAAVVAIGATPYIPFKDNTTGEGPELWRKMWAYFTFNRAAFLERYHQRSNVETAFAMIKAKFGASLKAKTFTAQRNEVLCKVLAHNICVLIGSMYELGIQPMFTDATCSSIHPAAPVLA